MSEQEIASREWHTRARVRILEEHKAASVDPYLEHTFRAGQEYIMVQWGRAGRPVDRRYWWTSFDIDGSFIIEASKVEVLTVIEEIHANP